MIGEPYDFRDLNRQFYAGDPAGYFRSRVNVLHLLAARPGDVAALLGDGVTFEGLSLRLPDQPETEEDQRRHEEYLITESQTLLHHAGEALVRLYLGHAGFPPCPWVEISGLRDFRIFKGLAVDLAKRRGPDFEDEVAAIFLGQRREAVMSHEDGSDLIDGGTNLLRTMAKRITEDAPIYNAVKHGMTVCAGTSGLSVTSEQTGEGVGHMGHSVAFLEFERRDGVTYWREKTRWVSVPEALALTHLCATQMSALWTVAKMRYLSERTDGVEAVSGAVLASLLRGKTFRRPGMISFTRNLFEEHPA